MDPSGLEFHPALSTSFPCRKCFFNGDLQTQHTSADIKEGQGSTRNQTGQQPSVSEI